MKREKLANPYAPPAIDANDGLSISDGLRFELTQKDLQQAANRCAMQVHSIFGSIRMFAVAVVFVLVLALSLSSSFFFVYWLLTLAAAFAVQRWFSQPIRKRIMQNSANDPALSTGVKCVAIDPDEETIRVEFNSQRREFLLRESRVRSDGDPARRNRSTLKGMSSIVVEVSKDHILVIPGHAFPSTRDYRDFLKMLKRRIRGAKRSTRLAKHAS